MVSEGSVTNRNASRRCNDNFAVGNLCDVFQDQAGIIKNGSIVGMPFHDCKRGLPGSEELG